MEMMEYPTGECKSCEKLVDKIVVLEQRVKIIVKWLEENQPDVFSRGLWDAIIKQEGK